MNQTILDSFRPGLFDGMQVVVSGASSGIGLAIARGFCGLGAKVLATGSSAQKLQAQAASAENAGLRFAQLDVRRIDEVQRLFGELPAIDVLINAQGVAKPEDEWTEAGFLDVVDINMSSQFRLAMAALPQLKAARGSIINIASMLSYLADDAVPAYCASKAGVLGLTRALAHRFGPDGVRVNAVAPGYHRTDMTRALWDDPVHEARIAQRSALKRWGTVDDLVGACAFLCSPAAAFVTGVVLPVDGGYHTG